MDFQVYDIAIIPLIVTIVGLIQSAGVSKRFLPLVAIVLGEAAAFLYLVPDDPRKAALVGLVAGLTAVGAHSGVKNTLGK